METIIPRNDPSSESTNEWKGTKAPFIPGRDVENRVGAETGVSPLNEWGASAGESAPFRPPENEINISASTENRSAKFKNPQVKQDEGAGAGQYQ